MRKIFPPTTATGNSHCLVTLGAAGEILAFYYPRIDFARNVCEAMTAVYLHEVDGEPLAWCFGDCWQRQQEFLGPTNVVRTTLRHREHDITIETTDIVPPNQQALVRHLHMRRAHAAPRVTLYHYFDLMPNDVPDRNAVQYLPDARILVQHFRDIALAVGADRPFTLQCGNVPKRGPSGVKRAMHRGRLDGGDQCIGNVDFAIAFDVGAETEWDVVIALTGGRTRTQACRVAERLRQTPFDQLQADCEQRSARILSRTPPCPVDDLTSAYHRAILSLHDLYDENEGTFIAAPEFDPGFVYSGGYGYCWPRDAASAALATARAGFVFMAWRFFDWSRRTQLEDGHWYQRYWTDGSEAPSWCVREDEIQLDQTCAVLHAAGQFARLLGRSDKGRDSSEAFVERYKPTALKAAAAIRRHLDENGLHRSASDLWECSRGCFAYTLGGVIAALREAQEEFGADVPDLTAVRDTLIEQFWSPERRAWARRIDPKGHLDPTLDSSALGLIDPWQVLDLSDTLLASIASNTVETVSTKLVAETKGGPAILRFQDEHYMGGGPGCVNTLWLALCRLRLAQATADPNERRRQVGKARELIHVALANTNPTGQLPELIPKTNFDCWAAPHTWACALLVECVLAFP